MSSAHLPTEPTMANATEDVATGVKGLFDRVGEFFHIFDLSFLVAGASTLSALLFAIGVTPWALAGLKLSLGGGVALLLLVYIAGLLSFAIGRQISVQVFRTGILRQSLKTALQWNGLESVPSIEVFLKDPKKADDAEGSLGEQTLYGRLWQELATRQPKSLPFYHVSRYWAMAATYDGVAASFLAWCVAGIVAGIPHVAPLRVTIELLIAPVAAGAAVICFRQAARYYRYQIGDVVAALAATRASLV